MFENERIGKAAAAKNIRQGRVKKTAKGIKIIGQFFDRGKSAEISAEELSVSAGQSWQEINRTPLATTNKMFGVDFSYEIIRAGGALHRLEVKVGPDRIVVQWQPTQGSFDKYKLDAFFGSGNGEKVFERLS